jgi:hypothetical protein
VEVKMGTYTKLICECKGPDDNDTNSVIISNSAWDWDFDEFIDNVRSLALGLGYPEKTISEYFDREFIGTDDECGGEMS